MATLGDASMFESDGAFRRHAGGYSSGGGVHRAGLYDRVGMGHIVRKGLEDRARGARREEFGRVVRWHALLLQRLRRYDKKCIRVDMERMPSVATALARFKQFLRDTESECGTWLL